MTILFLILCIVIIMIMFAIQIAVLLLLLGSGLDSRGKRVELALPYEIIIDILINRQHNRIPSKSVVILEIGRLKRQGSWS